MMKRYLVLVAILLIAAHASYSSALADMVYHSERLPFLATGVDGHPVLRSGFIVNVHPDGPVVGAIQRYTVQGARPNTEYNIIETIFEGCSAGSGQLLSLPRGTLTTDSHGNGYAEFVISAEELAPYSGLTIGASWTLEDGSLVAYRTPCTIGTID
jgi:hypothetical protein